MSGNGLQLVVGGCECTAFIESELMDTLYVLIPLSVFLVLCILGGLWWAVQSGQFDSVEQEGERILHDD
jgi:cbb3-type cytochrome oxidase maturation protein